MTPLEAARKMLDDPMGENLLGDPACPFCDVLYLAAGSKHAPDCPWIAMPKIVAALEIVRELAERGPFADRNDMGDVDGCNTCSAGVGRDINDPANHEPSCLWRRARELHPPTD